MLKFSLITFICISLAYYTKATPSTRIIGGVNAHEGQFPHQVSLRRYGFHTCGGSIISRNFILTAAHCVGKNDNQGNYHTHKPSVITVRIGTTDRFEGGVLNRVDEVIAHENYGIYLNDVALLRLEEPIIFSDNIKPIPLATTEVPAGENVTISGWGRLNKDGDLAQTLQWNVLTAISRKKCKDQINMDSGSFICLTHTPNNGACTGDSGGPAIHNDKIVGIAGFVYGGCGTSYPDVYAKVYYHVDWIKNHSDV